MAGRARVAIVLGTTGVAFILSVVVHVIVMSNPNPAEREFGAVFFWPLIFGACFFVGGVLLAATDESGGRIALVAALTSSASALVLLVLFSASDVEASDFAVFFVALLGVPSTVSAILGASTCWIVRGWGGWRDLG